MRVRFTPSRQRLVLQGHARVFGPRDVRGALPPLLGALLLRLPLPATLGLLALGWVGPGVERWAARRRVRFSPEEILITRGWKQRRLPRFRVRRVRLVRGSHFVTLWLEVRDEPEEVEAFHADHTGGRHPPSPELLASLHQALLELDLRPSFEEPAPEPPKPEPKQPKQYVPPLWPRVELRGLPPEYMALVQKKAPLPEGARFLVHPSHESPWFQFVGSLGILAVGGFFLSRAFQPSQGLHWAFMALVCLMCCVFGLPLIFGAMGLMMRVMRDFGASHAVPAQGLYLLPEALIHVRWHQRSMLVARERVLGVGREKPSPSALKEEAYVLLREDSGQPERVFLADYKEEELRHWFEMTEQKD